MFSLHNFTVSAHADIACAPDAVSLDAVVRALVRHFITRERLLEWETAAEAELGKRDTN